MLIRPAGVVVDGELKRGLELRLEGEKIVEIQRATGPSEDYFVSPAFVNAHSHLEYRGMQDTMVEEEYWPWILEITQKKREQSMEEVREDTFLAAKENRAAGIAMIGETSDRPFAGEAMNQYDLGGVIFQEVLNIFHSTNSREQLEVVKKNAEQNRKFFKGPIYMSPHTPYTVDEDTLRAFQHEPKHFSIHVAETKHENDFFLGIKGGISNFYEKNRIPYRPRSQRVFDFLKEVGVARQGVQFVHCCDLDAEEVAEMAKLGITAAHCPRSNLRLLCPMAPIREMLDEGVKVGLGLDSPASGGPIDMFKEMRAAIKVSQRRRKPITPSEAWRMATSLAAESIWVTDWEIKLGSSVPLIKIYSKDASSVSDLIREGSPDKVEWLTESNPADILAS